MIDTLQAALFAFQADLVVSLPAVAALGGILVGFGTVVSGVSATAGYRFQRLGLQVMGASFLVILSHGILVEVYGAEVPLPVLLLLYGVTALILLQGLLNLLFGPTVGNRVVSSLLTSLLISIAYLIFRPFAALRDLFR